MSKEKRRKGNDEESESHQQKEYKRKEESHKTTSLDRARTNEVAQQGVPMCDTNAMMQAQQQQLPYLPPNYPGLP
uniref:Uncharacterized protein n=1 Tax=Romanomermis culicivorax TaxID=13658 RepID=A0A915HN73_ROMCU